MAGRDPITLLHDRMTKAAENGRGIHLSQTDFDWFVICGAYAKLLEAVADQRFDEACERILRTEGRLPTPPISPLSKTSNVNEMPKVFTVTSLAAWWGVNGTSIYSLINSGELPHFRIGQRLIRIRADAVLEYEREHLLKRRGE
jgi:excisionase family DNA binding protein